LDFKHVKSFVKKITYLYITSCLSCDRQRCQITNGTACNGNW